MHTQPGTGGGASQPRKAVIKRKQSPSILRQQLLLHPGDRTVVLIDGSNTHTAVQNLGFQIDYKNLHELFANSCRLVRMYYFTALPEMRDDTHHPIKPLTDWLSYNGYTVVSKPTKEFFNESTGQTRVKGNMDIEICITFMHAIKHADHIVLMTGDGDFRRLIEEGQNAGVRVSVISTTQTRPSMLADELRRQADANLDLTQLQSYIARRRMHEQNTRRLSYTEGGQEGEQASEFDVNDLDTANYGEA